MQVSWIDPEEVGRLLADLLPPEPAAAAPGKKIAGWDSGPLEFLAAPDAAPAQPPERSAPRVTEPQAASEDSEVPEEHTPPPVESFASAPEVARIRERLREVRERALAAGLMSRMVESAAPPPPPPVETAQPVEPRPPISDSVATSPAPEASHPPQPALEEWLEVPLGPLPERLDALTSWMRQRYQPRGLFVLNEQGDILWGSPGESALALSALLAARAATRSSASAIQFGDRRLLCQPLAEGVRLSVVTCHTIIGVVHVVMERPIDLVESEAAAIQNALTSTIAADG
jgi:hypothetical protein